MDKKTRFAIVGGDKRNIALAEKLFKLGYEVRLFGFVNYERELPMQCKRMDETMAGADYVIGPIPFTLNGGALNTPFHNAMVPVEEVLRAVASEQVLLAGYIKPEAAALAAGLGVQLVDMLHREELLVLNAIPTAEGAIKVAIDETDITLHSNHMLVIGYGRIGAILCRMLQGMGAKVTTVVRRAASAAEARSCGIRTIMTQEMDAQLAKADVIFNTAPQVLLDRRNMPFVRKGTLIVDLASAPYGVDVHDARDFGLRVLYANSLPGKVAPVTTAGYILDTIAHIVNERQAGQHA